MQKHITYILNSIDIVEKNSHNETNEGSGEVI